MIRRIWISILLIVFGVMSVNAQTTDHTPPSETFRINSPALSVDDRIAFFWFAHTAADVGAVDIYADGYGETPLIEQIGFGEATRMVVLRSGAVRFVARLAGSGAGGEVVASQRWEYPTNTSWLVSLVGQQANFSVAMEPITLLRNEIGGSTRVRVVNWIAEVPGITVTSADGGDFGRGLRWIGIKDVTVQPGNYALGATMNDGSALIAPQTFTFSADTFNVVMLMGSRETARFVHIAAPQDETRVRFVNNRADAVDIYMRPGNELAAGGVQPGQMTEYVSLPSRAATFIAYAAGAGRASQELAAIYETLRSGRDLTIAVRADRTMVVVETGFTPGLFGAE